MLVLLALPELQALHVLRAMARGQRNEQLGVRSL